MSHPAAVTAPLADRIIRDPALLAFAEAVGGPDDGSVAVQGGSTQWSVGGLPSPGTRLVRAPSGVVAFEPAEMTVQVRAGTTLGELDEVLAAAGQRVALGGLAREATVGGVLSVGRSGITRLGHGPVRDTLLQARYVSAEGLLITAGGPTVKNVTGFDLPRLLVGALGTLGLLGEVTLRTGPRPHTSCWLAGPGDPFALRDALYRPSCLLWDGATTWLLLEGHAADVHEQEQVARAHGLVPVEGPPPLPAGRRSVDPGLLRRSLPGRLPVGSFIAEIGVGVLHGPWPPPEHDSPVDAATAPEAVVAPELVRLTAAIKAALDPTGRLNPGRQPLHAQSGPERGTIGP